MKLSTLAPGALMSALMCALMAAPTLVQAETAADRQKAVETGLLPAVVIAGLPSPPGGWMTP